MILQARDYIGLTMKFSVASLDGAAAPTLGAALCTTTGPPPVTGCDNEYCCLAAPTTGAEAGTGTGLAAI